jgi:hypothetical protein
MVTRSSRIALAIDAMLMGMFLNVMIDLQMPGPLVAALSVTSVVLTSVCLDALSAFQKRRAELSCSHPSLEWNTADQSPADSLASGLAPEALADPKQQA